MRRTNSALFVRAAVATLAFTSAGLSEMRDAEASGYLTASFGGSHGTPATPNTYAIYYNPAALGGTEGTTLTADLSLAVRWAHYKRPFDALSPSGNNRERLLGDQQYVAANTGDGNLLNVLALPFAGVNTDFGTKFLRGGYAIYVPFGGSASWDRRDAQPGAPGAQDGVQRWDNISGQMLALYNTFALALVIPDSGLSIGASFSPVIHHVSTVRARTTDDSDEINFPNGTLKEGRSYLDASGFNIAASAGIYWQSPDDARVKVGLAYLSQPGFGTTRMSGSIVAKTTGGDVTQDVDFLQAYPDVVRLGVNYRLPGDKVEIRTDGEFVRWSTFTNQCVVIKGRDCNVDNVTGAELGGTGDIIVNIPRNWKSAFGYRASVGYMAADDLEVFGSAGFSTSAVPKETIDASTIDSFRLLGAVGARYKMSRNLALAGSYNHLYFLPVSTNGANRFNELDRPSRSPSSDGKYTSQVGMLNVNVAYTF